MSSLNAELEPNAAAGMTSASTVAAAAETLEDPDNPAGGRAISRRGEEARGGFVLRAKSDEMPHRRRSLVERTGMRTLVQVIIKVTSGYF